MDKEINKKEEKGFSSNNLIEEELLFNQNKESEKGEEIVDYKNLMSSTFIFPPILSDWIANKDENNNLIGTIEIKTFPLVGLVFFHTIRRIALGLSSSYGVGGFKFSVKSQEIEIEPAHEYGSLRGLLEDVPTIHHNVKGIILKVQYTSENVKPLEYFTISIKKQINNSTEVRGSNIDVESYNNSQDKIKVEVANPDHLICTLDLNTEFKGEVLFRYGFGYISEGENEKYFTPLMTNAARAGWFFLSGQFSNGVLGVNGTIEEVTSGSVPYDNLTLSIITDGRIKPEEVFKSSCELLHQQIPYNYQNSTNNKEEKNLEEVDSYNREAPLSTIGISPNVLGILEREGIYTLGQLIDYGENSLKVMKGVGATKLKNIKEVLKTVGFSLRP